MKIVQLEDIPVGEYKTPKDNLMFLYSTGKKMELLCSSEKGMGLAAAQVSLPWNFFVYWSNYPSTPMNFEYLLDCEYEPSGNKFMSIEGCLSLGSKRFQLERYDSIIVKGHKLIIKDDDLFLEKLENKFEGTLAVIIQHEIDHSFGRDRMIDKIGTRLHIS